MNIGIDIDGVFTDLENYQLIYGKKYFKNIPVDEIDDTQIDIEQIFSCSKKEREKFWLKYIWKYCISFPPRRNAAAVINKLKDEGDHIHIITGRAHSTEKGIRGLLFRKMLINWLKKENIPYDSITFCKEDGSETDKLEACKKYSIDIMIDDKRENIELLSTAVKVLCFDAKYNQDCHVENLIRVNGFDEIYTEINKIKNNIEFTKQGPLELEKLNSDEKTNYFERLKEYYQNLPYDSDTYKKTEKNYIRTFKIFKPLINWIYKPIVFNKEFVPKENGVIFVANHNNYYDQFPIICAIGDSRPIHFLTATKMLKLKRGYFYLKTGAISVNRDDIKDRHNASLELKKIAVHGGNIFIFPEGRTNRGESFLLDFHPGAVAIAQETGRKIIPIAINFCDNRKVYVRFGKQIKILPSDNVIEKTNELKQIIGNLKMENEEENNKIKIKK